MIFYFLAFTLSITPTFAFALSSDKTKPLHITADDVNFNHKTGITVFHGNVKMDQGSTHLTGDTVTVYSDTAGNIIKIIALGNKNTRAEYITLPDQQKDVMNAKADSILYTPPKNLAVLLGHGDVTQGMNSFAGPHIIYDIQKQTVLTMPSEKNVQTVIVIQPQSPPGQKIDSTQDKAKK